jgi:hypothetical protein
MRATHTELRKALFFKLLGPTLLLLLPLLLLGGSLAEAGVRPQAAEQATVGQTTPSRLVVRVYFRNTAERDRLATELDALEVPTTGGYLTVMSDQAGVDALRRRGLRVEVDAEQTANANAALKFGNTPDNFFGGYHTVEEIQQFLDDEVAAHPTLAETVDYGNSWCKAHPGQCTLPEPNNGYDLLALHITNRNIPGPKPVLWLEANIHAREIAPAEIAVDYISYLLDNYDTDADAHWLVDWQDIYVVPTFNPDGHHIEEAGGGGQSPYYQRKNANNTNGCTTWPPNIGDQFGTDLNRNFSFLWNCCGGSNDFACSEAYHGAAAASEDETQAVIHEVSALIPDQRGPGIGDIAPITTTGAFLDLHSFADVNLYPWGMYDTPAPNETDLKNLGFHMSSTSAYPPGNDYTPCQFGSCLYIADGASNDWAYGELGAAAFAVEIGEDFFEPYTYTQSTLWPQNRGMMLYMARVSRMPYLLTRGPDATDVSTEPMTVTQGIQSELSATINYAWNYHGAYSNYMENAAAAEYYLDTPPWAGGTPVAMQAVDGAFDNPVEGVHATVQTDSIPVGRHILFVRGRGATSYEGHQSWGPVSASWLVVQPYASPTATATGTPPTATPTLTTPPTSTPTSTPCSAPEIQNGGFETGSFTPGWTILETEPAPVVSTAHAHSGTHAAFLGSLPNNEPTGNSSIYQQFNVPASGGTLSFWYYPYSRDNIQFDWQDAYITDVNGNILATVLHVLEGTETWTNVTYNLDAYAGQTLRVEFLVHQDGAGDVAFMYVDDVMVLEPCATPVPGTPTSTNTPVVTAISTSTDTPLVTATAPVSTPTACPVQFIDVPEGSTFYPYIRCLACRGIVSGYADGTFRPQDNVTRGQLSKIVSNSADFQEPPGAQQFEDVAVGSTFYDFVWRLASRGYISGYPCGGPGEPCGPTNLPYFRPNSNATRGQISKIVSNVAGFIDPPGAQLFEDVLPGSTFYDFIQRLASRGIINGYPCGGSGEPCGPNNLPYFRPNDNATRGQTSKIDANTFFPGCALSK